MCLNVATVATVRKGPVLRQHDKYLCAQSQVHKDISSASLGITAHPRRAILLLVIYVRCRLSVPAQEVVGPPVARLIFTLEARVCVLSQIISDHALIIVHF